MTQKKKNQKKKWAIVLVGIVLLIGVGTGTYFVLKNLNGKKNDNTEIIDDNQKKDEIVKVDSSKDDGGNGSGNGDENSGKPKVIQYDGDNPNEAETLSGAITFAGVTENILMIRVNIDQYLESGECELTLRKGNDTIYNSIASIIGGPSTATCEGFDVSTAGLGGGKIQIDINLNANGRSGVIRGEANI